MLAWRRVSYSQHCDENRGTLGRECARLMLTHREIASHHQQDLISPQGYRLAAGVRQRPCSALDTVLTRHSDRPRARLTGAHLAAGNAGCERQTRERASAEKRGH